MKFFPFTRKGIDSISEQHVENEIICFCVYKDQLKRSTDIFSMQKLPCWPKTLNSKMWEVPFWLELLDEKWLCDAKTIMTGVIFRNTMNKRIGAHTHLFKDKQR